MLPFAPPCHSFSLSSLIPSSALQLLDSKLNGDKLSRTGGESNYDRFGGRPLPPLPKDAGVPNGPDRAQDQSRGRNIRKLGIFTAQPQPCVISRNTITTSSSGGRQKITTSEKSFPAAGVEDGARRKKWLLKLSSSRSGNNWVKLVGSSIVV